jgi:hypothetical protein
MFKRNAKPVKQLCIALNKPLERIYFNAFKKNVNTFIQKVFQFFILFYIYSTLSYNL